jgi:hypothetical protein
MGSEGRGKPSPYNTGLPTPNSVGAQAALLPSAQDFPFERNLVLKVEEQCPSTLFSGATSVRVDGTCSASAPLIEQSYHLLGLHG